MATDRQPVVELDLVVLRVYETARRGLAELRYAASPDERSDRCLARLDEIAALITAHLEQIDDAEGEDMFPLSTALDDELHTVWRLALGAEDRFPPRWDGLAEGASERLEEIARLLVPYLFSGDDRHRAEAELERLACAA